MSYDLFAYDKTNPMNYRIPNFYLSPIQWSACAVPVSLSWTIDRYSTLLANPNLLPDDKQGVYAFIIKPGLPFLTDASYVMYIGKAERQSFRDRFKQYIREKDRAKGRVAIKKLLKLWDDHLWYMYAEVANISDIERVEDELLAAFMPPGNNKFRAGIEIYRGQTWK